MSKLIYSLVFIVCIILFICSALNAGEISNEDYASDTGWIAVDQAGGQVTDGDVNTYGVVGQAIGGKAQDGAFERLTAEYDITDAFSLKAGCVFYQDGDGVMYDNIHDNNRVFVNLKYRF